MPQPPRLRFLAHKTPHFIELGCQAAALGQLVGAADLDLDVLRGEVLQDRLIDVLDLRSLFLILLGLWPDSRAAPAPYHECRSHSSPYPRFVAGPQAIGQRSCIPGETCAHVPGMRGTDSVACLQAIYHVARYRCRGSRDNARFGSSS